MMFSLRIASSVGFDVSMFYGKISESVYEIILEESGYAESIY